MTGPKSHEGLAHPRESYSTAQVGSVQPDNHDRKPTQHTRHFQFEQSDDQDTHIMEVFDMQDNIESEASNDTDDWYEDEDEHYFGESADAFRLVYQVGCVLALACYIIWGVQILWGS